MSSFTENPVEDKILKRGDILFKQGDKAKKIYLVSYGKLIAMSKASNRLVPLFVAEANSIVGEEGIHEGKWTYTAIAMNDSRLIPIDIKDISDFLVSTPDWVRNIIGSLNERMCSIQNLICEQKIIAKELSGGDELSAEDSSFLQSIIK